MNKKAIISIIFICIISMITYGSGNSEANTILHPQTGKNPVNTSASEHQINPGEKITLIKDGFSSVCYKGNYGFDEFLKQGGADTDSGVVTFLEKTLLANAGSLSFDSALFGCSTISVPNKEGGFIFGRNFDWMKSEALVVFSEPARGYRSISTVNLDFVYRGTRGFSAPMPDKMLTIAALYAPLDGMNEKGFSVAVNMIEDNDTINQNTERPDLTTTTAIRLLLDKAASVEEALSLLSSYDMHASFGYMMHLAMADAEGNSVVVEYVHNKMQVVPTELVTNFYLAQGDKQGIGSSQSHKRFEILSGLVEESDEMGMEEVRDILSLVSKGNFEKFLTTEWTILFDQRNLIARYYHRENYKESYSFSF